MEVKFVDLDRQLLPIRDAIDTAMQRVIGRGPFVRGPEVAQFEDRFADYVGAEYAVAVSSGTDALIAALLAMGVRDGDEVITSPFASVSAAKAVAKLGATPVYVDIEPGTFSIDVEAVRAAIGPNTVGIVPVHLFGQTADLSTLQQLAAEHDLFLLEDAGQAIGARHGDQHAGTVGDLGCFCFFPTKTLGAFGDGGMVVTNDDDIARRLRQLQQDADDGEVAELSGSLRIDTLQAAILEVKLDHLDGWIEARRSHAEAYQRALPGSIRPAVGAANDHAWHQYVIRVSDRDGLRERMWAEGIETQIYYPTSCECQPCMVDVDQKVVGDLKHAHTACEQVLALPVYPELSVEERERVIRAVRSFLAAQAA